jgi:peptide/nickel transport system permease protein
MLLGVSMTSFVLVALIPGDPARAIVGTEGNDATYRQLRKAMGLDLPLYQQYWRWLRHALGGDLGASLATAQPVTTAIDTRLPITASLILGALAVTVIVGVAIGFFSALRGGIAARLVDSLALVGFALPSFWVGAVLIATFAVHVRWFPATGYVALADSPKRWALSLVLPVVALALHSIAAIAKQTREALLDTLASEHIRMAWAAGLSPRSILLRHALRPAAVRIVTMLGLLSVGLLSGTVFVESVFAIPGLGGLAVDAALAHDLPMIQGVVVYFTAFVVVINLVVDLAYTWLNPRVRTG